MTTDLHALEILELAAHLAERAGEETEAGRKALRRRSPTMSFGN
jgi:hypothetical protein